MLHLMAEVAAELREQGRAEITRERLERYAAGLYITAEQIVERLASMFDCSFELNDERALLLPHERAETITAPPRRACVCPRAFETMPVQSCCFL
jgi:hypothetical protein